MYTMGLARWGESDHVEQPVVTQPVVAQPVVAQPVVAQPVVEYQIDKSLFPEAVHPLLDLLITDAWPEAAPKYLICEDSENDKLDRADGILDYIGISFKDKKVLDFGCGEGHVSDKAAETAILSVGYDIVQPSFDSNKKNCILTSDFSNVTKNGPYDIIILYDVLDHCKDVLDALNQVKSVSDSQTKIFIRCHSWMSRHGAHLYKKLNKAWVHLIFSEEDLNKMGVKMDFVRKYYFPVDTQNKWFKESGFKVLSSEIIKSPVDSFFKCEELKKILSKNFDGKFPEWQMSQCFNDYVLGF